MTFRPKTTRRLLILIVIAGVVIGGGTALVSYRLHRFQMLRLATRAEAFDAYRHGDYPTALAEFHHYFGSAGGDDASTDADASAIYAYAVCRARVPGPDLGYLVTAKSIFDRYLELVPNDSAAEHQLLWIYRRLGYDAQSAPLADALLRQNPDDVPALRAKLRLLNAAGHADQALPVARRVNGLAPLDLQGQIATLTLMQSVGAAPRQIVARADGLLNAHPGDARFLLLRGIAAEDAQDSTAAAVYLRRAVTAVAQSALGSVDDNLVLTLAGTLDRAGLYGDAVSLLERTADAKSPSDPAVLDALLERQWERGDDERVIRRVAQAGVGAAADSTLAALQALALYSRSAPGDTARAGALLAMLEQRPDDTAATAWADLLRCRFAAPAAVPPQAAELCRAAIALAPSNAMARYFLGQCENDVGESELAVEAWRDAGELAPAWASPHLLAARALLADGRAREAAGEAGAAVARARAGSADAIGAAAVAVAADYAGLARDASPSDLRRVLSGAEDVQKESPGEPLTLPIEVDLLARSGDRGAAGAAASKALAIVPSISIAATTALAPVVARDHLLSIDAAADAILRERPAISEQGLEQANALAAIGRGDAAMHRLMVEARTHPTSPRWRLVLLEFRAAHGGEGNDASSAAKWGPWAVLADSCPGDPIVQRGVLAAAAAWENRQLIVRTIERYRHLTGEQGLRWRLAQARWQLSAPDEPKGAATDFAAAAAASMAEVVRTAPTLAEPRVLWALALEKLGDVPGAIARLRDAATIAPHDPAVIAQLQRLLALPSAAPRSTMRPAALAGVR